MTHRFSLRAIFIATAAVAVVSAIAVAFRPRDFRNEIEKVAKMSQTFQKDELVGDYKMPYDELKINSDGTYRLTISSSCFTGCDFDERGNWLLDRNIISFQASPSPTNSGAPLKWAFATTQDGEVTLIADFFAKSYLDRGYVKSHSYRKLGELKQLNGEDQPTD